MIMMWIFHQSYEVIKCQKNTITLYKSDVKFSKGSIPPNQYADIPNEAFDPFATTSNSLTITDQLSSASGYVDAPPAIDDISSTYVSVLIDDFDRCESIVVVDSDTSGTTAKSNVTDYDSPDGHYDKPSRSRLQKGITIFLPRRFVFSILFFYFYSVREEKPRYTKPGKKSQSSDSELCSNVTRVLKF
jgi:hypothetical protein